MANYEEGQTLTEEQLEGLKKAGVTDEVVKALNKVTAEQVAVIGSDSKDDKASVSGQVNNQGVVATNIDGMNLALPNSIIDIFDNVNGQATNTNQQAVTTSITNSNVNYAIDNDADNNVGMNYSEGTLSLGNGNNNVTFGVGNNPEQSYNKVDTKLGDGNNNVNIFGQFTGDIETGNGNNLFVMDETAQNNAEISVDAGDGFDLLTLLGQFIHHQFSYSKGQFHMHSGNVVMQDVDIVATDVNKDGNITLDQDHITILATTEQEALIAKLYKVGLGREAIDGEDGWNEDGAGATLGGFRWWVNNFGDKSDEDIAQSLLNCDEFNNRVDSLTGKTYAQMSNAEYVTALFNNLGASNAELADKLVNELNNGGDRINVALEIAQSDLAVKVLGNDGQQYVIEGFDDNA